MFPILPISASSDHVTISGSSATFGTINAMSPGQFFLYMANTDTWIKQSAAGTAATAGAGSMFVPARVGIVIDGLNGAKLSAIEDSAGGAASLTPVRL